MTTPAEEFFLPLLETWLESLTAFKARLEAARDTPATASELNHFRDQLAWLCAEESAIGVPPPPSGGAAMPAACVALATAVTCRVREISPPTWCVQTMLTAAGLPPWAHGMGHFVASMSELASAAKPGRALRARCRAAGRHLAAVRENAETATGLAALLEAELCSRNAEAEAAAQRYEAACSRLAHSPFVVLHALALQLAANHHLRTARPIAATGFRQEAAKRYQAWGNAHMARSLHPAFSPLAATGVSDTTHDASRLGSSGEEHFSRDLRAAIIATQAVAGDAASTTPVKRIMDTLRVLTGAGRVALVMEKSGKLEVEVDTQEPPDALPDRLVAYAMRSGDPVLLEDLARSAFDDPYFSTHRTGSLLCVPWQQPALCSAAVLLENTATAGAFSTDRIGIVRFLTATAATASVHASLRIDMEETIAQRIRSGNEAIEQAGIIRRSNSEMQMAGGFAHELRNSLAATRFALSHLTDTDAQSGPSALDDDIAGIRTCLQQLQDAPSPDSLRAVRHALETLQAAQEGMQAVYEVIAEGLERGLDVAKSIMDFGRISNDTRDGPAILLETSVHACLSRHAVDTKLAPTRWDIRIPPQLTVPLSAKHINALLDVLVSNAMDACCSKDAEAGHITIEASSVAGALLIRVADNGDGMSLRVQKRAFDPFFSTKGTGHPGLGLTMARKIAHLNGGNIHLASAPKQGCVVELRFST